MGISNNESSTTFKKATESIPIAYFYAEKGHNKDAFFLWRYKSTPIWFEGNFLDDFYDF